MNLPASIFKAYDIRGIVDQTLTEEGVLAIGQALGLLMDQQGQSRCQGTDPSRHRCDSDWHGAHTSRLLCDP
jgi:phosphomannomutase